MPKDWCGILKVTMDSLALLQLRMIFCPPSPWVCPSLCLLSTIGYGGNDAGSVCGIPHGEDLRPLGERSAKPSSLSPPRPQTCGNPIFYHPDGLGVSQILPKDPSFTPYGWEKSPSWVLCIFLIHKLMRYNEIIITHKISQLLFPSMGCFLK